MATPDERTAVVVIAHGSRAEAANDAHRATVAELGERLPHEVSAAFLELAEPDIPTAIRDAVAGGANEVLVLPYFLYPGRHIAEDIPALVSQAAAENPDARIRLLDAFGADPAVLDTLTAQVERAHEVPPDA